MPSKLEEAFAAADWDKLVPRLEGYADTVMRRYIWRGLKVTVGLSGQLLVDTRSADDFVVEAIGLLVDGTRAYKEELTLEQNLRSIIESRISNWKKKSDRKPLVDHAPFTSDDGEEFDPILAAVDPKTTGSSEAELSEARAHQKKLLHEFKDSIAGDTELADLLNAYESDFTKPAEIEELTGISAARVYELKRKLQSKMTKFMINHPSVVAAGLIGEFI